MRRRKSSRSCDLRQVNAPHSVFMNAPTPALITESCPQHYTSPTFAANDKSPPPKLNVRHLLAKCISRALSNTTFSDTGGGGCGQPMQSNLALQVSHRTLSTEAVQIPIHSVALMFEPAARQHYCSKGGV
eukprot:5849058-Amphidinium_carterae.2